MNLADAAEQYASLGWALVQLDGKMPIGHGWQQAKPMDPQSARSIWEGKNCNMGIVLGPSGVIDFELDSGDEDLYWRLANDGYDHPQFLTGSGKPHILFKDPGGLSRRTRDGLELRAGSHQSVLPPSIHPETGKQYTWLTSPLLADLRPPPRALLDFFNASSNGPSESHWRKPLSSGNRLGPGEGRHASLVSFAGKAVNLFDTPEQLVAATRFYCHETHDPPYPDEVIEEQALDIWGRYRESPEAEAAEEESREYLKIRPLSEIQMKTVEFVWKPWLQRAAFHLLVGEKGAGKGSFLTWLAAQMTKGFDGALPRGVLWIKTEDSFEIDVKPRFVAQGGDESLCYAVHKHVHLPDDLPHIEAACREYSVGLVVIDPVVGVIGGANTNDEGAIVSAIGGLNDLANKLDLMVIGVRHLGKGYGDNVLSRILGSVAWVNTPRAVLGLAKSGQDSVLQLLISNRVRERSSYKFHIEQAKVEGLDEEISKVVPVGLTTHRVQDFLEG